MSNLKKIYREVANMIFEREAFQFGEFKLKLHEKNPDAPLSPFYLNLRTSDNPTNPGPLTQEDCDLIAKLLWEVITENELEFQAIAGLPHAADPIIIGIKKIVPNIRVVEFTKKTEDDYRQIILSPGFDKHKNESVLVIDDLITKADSKLEAIKAIESSESFVKNLVVLIDRQQGGKEQLKKAGYSLFSCFTITELLGYYEVTGKISTKKYQECLEYIKNN
jgi:orotate phosphoribosyltransferase